MKTKILFLLNLLTMTLGFNAQPGFVSTLKHNVPIDSIMLSDPAILADKATNMYYMTGSGELLWKSKNLKVWDGPYQVVAHDKSSWMGEHPMIWAAELHAYKGKYYYFATFTNYAIKVDTVNAKSLERRSSHVLVSNKPDGPYVPMRDDIYLPANKLTLDGTFWVDKDSIPYMVYCHEWLQNYNGTVERIRLKPDLSGTIGEEKILFRSSNSPWSRERGDDNLPSKCTDRHRGCFAREPVV
jgi:beta-xylosidase